MRQAASTVKSVGLELGGNAPFIVFDDADLDKAVAGRDGLQVPQRRPNLRLRQPHLCAGRRLRCVCRQARRRGGEDEGRPRHRGGRDARVRSSTPTPSKKVEDHVADAIASGAKVQTGGRRHALGGNFYEPTILAGVTPKMMVAREETFGPVAPLFKFETEAEVIAMANDTPFGLAAYFYARDVGRVWRVAEALECGIIGINEGIISTELAPFGGVKESGIGREGSHHGVEEFLEIKYMMIGGL